MHIARLLSASCYILLLSHHVSPSHDVSYHSISSYVVVQHYCINVLSYDLHITASSEFSSFHSHCLCRPNALADLYIYISIFFSLLILLSETFSLIRDMFLRSLPSICALLASGFSLITYSLTHSLTGPHDQLCVV